MCSCSWVCTLLAHWKVIKSYPVRCLLTFCSPWGTHKPQFCAGPACVRTNKPKCVRGLCITVVGGGVWNITSVCILGVVLCIRPGLCPLIVSLVLGASVLADAVGPTCNLRQSSCCWLTIALTLRSCFLFPSQGFPVFLCVLLVCVCTCMCVGDREDGTEQRNFQIPCTCTQPVRSNQF